jgi:outer membrane protein assembly factor BamD
MRRSIILLIPIILVLFVSSCKNQEFIKPGDSLIVAFEKAKSLYDAGEWGDAARAFETVLSIGRGTEIAEEAQYLLAESYFKNESYLVAASEFERFTLFHPDSPLRQDSDYKIALCYLSLSPRFKLDQTYTDRAIENFRVYISRYPDASQADTAGFYIDDLRNKLAEKLHHAADFYMRIDRYNAAAIYFEQVISQYPESEWAEIALVEQMEAYILYADNSIPERQEERYEKALDSYRTYLQLFPRGEQRSKAEELYDVVQQSLERVRALGVAASTD